MKTNLLVNTILDVCVRRGIRIRPMKLQKLMFFTCGLHVANSNKWIIDNDFYAYPYGPVEKESYRYFSKYGPRYITEYMHADEVISEEKQDIYENLELTLRRYGRESDFDLSHITHEKDSPWDKAWKKKRYSIIDKQIIRDYYKKKIDNNELPSS